MFERTAINFNDYFWTPYPFIMLLLITLFESFLAFKFLSPQGNKAQFIRIAVAFLFANIVSFFLEYFFFAFLNGGHRILIWIPWVKIINTFNLFLYLISFPVIFLFTILSEYFIAFVFLRKKYQWKKILKTIFFVNLISTILLIIIFNCIVFNIIKGEEEGIFDQIIPELPLQK
jgi:hypothetical protein